MTALIAAVVTAIATYFSTISGLELAVVEKADRDTVAVIEQRLVAIETLLESASGRLDGIESRSIEMHERLMRIESAVLRHRESPHEP